MHKRGTKLLLAHLGLLALLLGPATASPGQRHRQVATCSLEIAGSSQGVGPVLHKGSFHVTTAVAPLPAVLQSISLHCTSSDGLPVPVGINSSIITAQHQQGRSFSGVELVADRADVRQACGVPFKGEGTAPPLYPLLSFCGDFHVDFTSFTVQGVQLLDDTSSEQRSHLVLMGGSPAGSSVTATIDAARVENNTARSALMFAGSSRVNISRMHCAGNLGFIGACVVVTSAAAVQIQQSTITHCRAHVGPGVTVLQDARVYIVNSSFTSCKASDSGGAVSLRHFATAEIDNTTFIGNSGGQHGGAVDIYCAEHHSCRAQLANCTFQANKAQKGGAIDGEDAVVTVYGTQFVRCSAGLTGGALRARNAVMSIINSSVVNCSVSGAGHGGAVAAYRNSDLLVAGSTLLGNSAAFGGAIFASAIYDGHRCTVHIDNCTLSGNTAVLSRFVKRYEQYRDGGQGGAVYGYMADISIVGSNVTSNTARAFGGGVSVKHRAVLRISGTRVVSNVAHDLNAVGAGGGLAVADAQVSVHNSSICSNTAWESGGGVWVAKSNMSVFDSALSHNNCSGPAGKGGMLHMLTNSTVPRVVELHGNTISDNGAPKGGAVYAFVKSDESDDSKAQQHSRLVVNSSVEASRSYIGRDLFLLGSLHVDLTGSNLLMTSHTVLRQGQCVIGDNVTAAGDVCELCPTGMYSLDSDHQQSCQPCPDHATCVGGAVMIADPGFFHAQDYSGMCSLNLSTILRCPNPQACQHVTSAVEPHHPYYSFLLSTGAPSQYAQEENWHTYNTKLCTTGYRGLLCGNCRDGFGQTDAFSCSACLGVDSDGNGEVDQEGIFFLLATYALLFAAAVGATISLHLLDQSSPTTVGREDCALKAGFRRRKPSPFQTTPDELQLTDVIKALLMYGQYLAGIIAKLPVIWPPVLASSMGHLSELWSRAFGSSASLDCLIKPFAANNPAVDPSGLKALLTLLAPVLILVFVTLLHVVWWACQRQLCQAVATLGLWLLQLRQGNDCSALLAKPGSSLSDMFKRWCMQQQLYALRKPAGNRRGLPTLSEYLYQRCVVTLVVTLFFFYPSVVRVATSMLTCVSVPTCDKRFWIMDMDRLCPLDDPWSVHGRWALGVGIPALLFCVAVPLFVIGLLWRAMEGNRLHDPDFEQRFGFMYSDYKERVEEHSLMASIEEGEDTLFDQVVKCPSTTRILKQRLVIAWDAVVHMQTMILVVVSVGGLVLHEYYQTLILSGAFGAYLILILWLQPFRGVYIQRLQELSSVVLFVTCQMILLFIPPDGMDTRQDTSHERALPMIGGVLLAINIAFVGLALYLMLRCLLRKLSKPKIPATYHMVASQPLALEQQLHHESPPESPAVPEPQQQQQRQKQQELELELEQATAAPLPARLSCEFKRTAIRTARRSSFSYSPAEAQRLRSEQLQQRQQQSADEQRSPTPPPCPRPQQQQSAEQQRHPTPPLCPRLRQQQSAEQQRHPTPPPCPRPRQMPGQQQQQQRPAQEPQQQARSTARRPGPSRRNTFRL